MKVSYRIWRGYYLILADGMIEEAYTDLVDFVVAALSFPERAPIA